MASFKLLCMLLVVMLVAHCAHAEVEADEMGAAGRKLAAGEEQELWYKKGYPAHKGPWKKGYHHHKGPWKKGYHKGKGPGHPH